MSPYEYKMPYGGIFKFSSNKKLEIFSRELPKRIDKVEKNYDVLQAIAGFEEWSMSRKVLENIATLLYWEVEGKWPNTVEEGRKVEKISLRKGTSL
jgi:hypothetical protein